MKTSLEKNEKQIKNYRDFLKKKVPGAVRKDLTQKLPDNPISEEKYGQSQKPIAIGQNPMAIGGVMIV